MNLAKRWKVLDRVLLLSLAFVVLFAWMDATQIQFVYAVEQADKWVLYSTFSAPAILVLWYAILAGLAIVYYLFTKDKSESVALFVVPSILLFFGLQDLLFFAFSPTSMPVALSWLDYFPQTFFAGLIGQDIATPLSLTLSSITGMIVAWFTYKKLKKV